MITAHTDVVGSLLRPTWLLRARRDLAAGRINEEELTSIEDRAVDEAIALQEDVGLEIVTDGEMRRLSFQSCLLQAVDGFGAWDLDAFLWGDWHGDEGIGDVSKRRPERLGVVDKLVRRRWLSADEFSYLKDRTTRTPKATLPSPSLFASFWSRKLSRHAYPSLTSFLTDVASILRDDVNALVRCGATYIQLDAPHYPLLLDPRTRAFYEGQGWSLDTWLRLGVELDNEVIGVHPGVTVGLHLCKGNQASRWLVEGGYDRLVGPIVRRIKAQRLLLEYDDQRSGSFAALGEIPEDKMVVLGLVTTKRSRRSSVAELRARIEQAARFFPLEQLALSPQCGFSSSIIGNRITVQQQRDKLREVVETARAVWG